jgi:biopolymer transport protein ExbD
MAKRRHAAKDEILLVPFLDILCSLIGVLVLIIVVLCVSMTEQTDGRPEAEVEMAQEAKKLRKIIEEQKKAEIIIQEKIATLDEIKKQLEEKQQRFIKLRKLRDTSKDIIESNQKLSQQMQKELDDLLVEIDGLVIQQTESQKAIAALQAELKERQVPPDKKVPPVVVQPGGSGIAAGTAVFFIEASAGALKVLGAWGNEDYRLSATAEVVVADAAYNHFLTEVAKLPKSLLLFLVREDGAAAFNNGAGRAEADYNLRVSKLPVPGRGVLDLKMFEKFRGKVPPPPAAAPAPSAPAKANDKKKADTPKKAPAPPKAP